MYTKDLFEGTKDSSMIRDVKEDDDHLCRVIRQMKILADT